MGDAVIETSAKDFGRYPELLAVHVDRIKRAHAAADRYMRPSALRTDGLITIEKFLLTHDALRIAREIEAVRPGDARRPDSLLSATDPISVTRRAAHRILGTLRLIMPDRESEINRLFWQSTYLQHLFNRPDDNDIQKHYHCDTFFPALKFWYFPREVTELDGPLWYVPGSPILTPVLLEWHQRQADAIAAGTVEPWRGRGHTEGSLRVSRQELADMGLRPLSVTVPANTLVIANVFGFHRRGDVPAPAHRLAIHGSIRFERPFQ